MKQRRAFWILVAFACANFVCVPVHAEKEVALNVTDDFSATEPDAKIWHVQGDVNIDEGAAVLVGHGWNGTGFWSRKSFGPGTTFEVEFTASNDSEFAIFVGPFATSGNYFVQFLSAKENYGIGCYGQSGGRKACTVSWMPGKKQRAKIELTEDGYRFYFDPGEGYELAADISSGHIAGGQFGFQQRSGRGAWDNVQISGTALRQEEINEPDVVVHYRETYAAFPDIIRLHNGSLLMVMREGTHHMEDPEHGRVVGRISTDAGRTWGEAMVICDTADVDDRDPFAWQTADGVVWVGCQGQRPWPRGQTKELPGKELLPQDYDANIVRSFDGGKTWEEPILVSKTIEGDNFIMYPVMEMSNGEFLWMGCSPMWKIHEDGTREWLLPKHKVYHETHILKNPNAKKDFLWETYTHPQLGQFDEWDIEELEPGHLICILRSSPDSSQFAQAESFDYGRTWKKHRLSGIIHNRGNRPRIDKLPDGKTLVVSYGLRRGAKVTAIPSFDGGRTWPADRRVTILHNPNYGPTGDFTYTAMVPSRENEYLFIYYAYPDKPGSPYRGIYGNFVPAKAFQE